MANTVIQELSLQPQVQHPTNRNYADSRHKQTLHINAISYCRICLVSLHNDLYMLLVCYIQ